MSSLIEQAAARLAQLRSAGAAMPGGKKPSTGAAKAPMATYRHDHAGAPSAGAAQVSQRIEIDLDALAASGIVSPNAPRSQIADQFRVIKRPLLGNAKGGGATQVRNGNLIMITSSVTGEGKTFTALNLAISMAAELDNTVMLVDADVARPSVMRTLGLPAGPGLLDLLTGERKDLSEVLLKTNIAKLSLLSSGTPQPNATEMLASESMAKLLAGMAERYPERIIIFDSPPLLLTTEARVLASHMGQVVMVIQAEKVMRSDVHDALATIEACPVKLLLLNQARASLVGSAYQHGYGYAYAARPV